jgi:CPA2 family monovalent cation:H+ antiporter-2
MIEPLLRDLVVTYAVALVFILVLARLRVPSLVALLAAGACAGPGGLGIVHTQDEVNAIAEIGIVLLLFTVGLDFSLAGIRRIWKPVLIGGALQLAGTAAAVAAAIGLTGLAPLNVAVFLGLFIALSSTAIVLHGLTERNQVDSPHGRVTVGILLFQDLSVIALLLVVPVLSGQAGVAALPGVIGYTLVVLTVVVVLGYLVLPPFLAFVARSGRREAFGVAVLLASIGMAWFGARLGVSMAIGAFLGGLVLAGGDVSHQVLAEIRPLRDLLATLFFVSLGMLLDLRAVGGHLPLILGLALAIVVTKALVACGTAAAAGTPKRAAVTAGLALAQVGEFSFILGQVGLRAGLIDEARWQVLLSASIGTMLMTPALLSYGPALGARLARGRQVGLGAEAPNEAAVSDHVVIVGFGLGGQLIAKALDEARVPYLVIELNAGTVERARLNGIPIVYGDAIGADVLAGAHVDRARAVAIVINDVDATVRAVKTVRGLAPAVPLIVRTRYRIDAVRLEAFGATVAVAEETETSLEVVAQLLDRLNVQRDLVERQLDRFRHESSPNGSAGKWRPQGTA